MSWSLTEFSSQKRLDQIPGQFRSFDASAQANDIEVVVLNSLFCRKVIFDQTGANALDLVRTNRGADAAATNRHATVHFSRSHRPPQRDNEVGIIIIRRQFVSAEINYVMARVAQSGCQLSFSSNPP